MSSNDNLKKRQRIPVSCSVCRKRKSKCDRVKPVCGTCKKKSIAHLCHYEGSPWMNDNTNYGQNDIPGIQRINFNHSIPTPSDSMTAVTNANMNNQANSIINGARINSVAPDMRSELQLLKEKVKQLEQSLDSPATTPVSTTQVNPPYLIPSNPPSNNSLQRISSTTLNSFSTSSICGNDNMSKNSPGIQHSHFMFDNISDKTMQNPSISQPTSSGTFSQNLPLMNHIQSHDSMVSDQQKKYFVYQNAIYIDQEETIDFFMDSASLQIKRTRWENHGPLSYTGLTKKDPFLRMFRVYTLSLLKNSKISDIAKLGKSDIGVANNLIINNIKKKSTSKHNYTNLTLANVIKSDYQKQTIDLVLQNLPNKKVTWLLFYRFFKFVYPIIPIVDENVLIMELKAIFGSFDYSEGNFDTINIDSKLDFATIAILLIILRFGYLTLMTINSDPHEYSKDESYLLQNPIPADIVAVAQRCLSNFNFLRKSSFKLVQAMFFLRCYFIYGPEDCDGISGGDSSILLSSVVQMAISIGLHRDPECFSYIKTIDRSMIQLWRKLWYNIVFQDVTESIKYGSPLNICDFDIFDTKLPNYKVDLVEIEINKSIKSMFELSFIFREIATMTNKVKNHTKIKDLLSKLDEIEGLSKNPTYEIDKLLSPINPINVPESHRKTKTLTRFIYLKVTSYVLYSAIWLHYENAGDFPNAIFFMKRSANIAAELLNLCISVLSSGNKCFGIGSELILIPTIQSAMMKTSLAQSAILMRCLHAEKLTEGQIDRAGFYQKMTNLYDITLNNALTSSEFFLKLSECYANSYKLVETMDFIVKQLKDNAEGFNKFLDDPGLSLYRSEGARHFSIPDNNSLLHCSDEEVDEFISICASIAVFDKNTISFYGISDIKPKQEVSPFQFEIDRALTGEDFAKLFGTLGDYDVLSMPDFDQWMGS